MLKDVERLLCSVLLLALPGCGLSYGFVRDASTAHHLSYDMNRNFSFPRTASGSSSGGKLLCLFPVSMSTYDEAMSRLHENAKLGANEAVVNLREDHVTRFYFFFCSTEVIVSGDVVSFAKR